MTEIPLTPNPEPSKTGSTSGRGRRMFGTAALGVALIAGAAVAAPTFASAQDADPTPIETVVPNDSVESEDEDRRGRKGHRKGQRLEALSEILGVTVEDLRDARESDQSIADIAAANGVAVDSVIDALVEARQEHLDAKVAEGRISADEAAERAEMIEDRVTEKVNTVPSEQVREGKNRDGHGGRGFRLAPQSEGT